MQLMWVSGPTASVKTVSITAQKVVIFVASVSFMLVLLGIILHFIGFRIAVEVSPGLARSLGGVTTEAEQQRQEAVYKDRLDKLRQSLNETMQEIHQLETLKNRFMDMATPVNLRDKISHKDEGRGGPWIAPRLQNSTGVLSDDLSAALEDFSHVNTAMKNLETAWEKQLKWINQLPTGVPVQKDFRITSVFGIRNDPFTGQLAMHEGLDFVSPPGSPVVSTASGTVSRSAWDNSYGNVIEVTHIEGYVTRYAHLERRQVQAGDKVERGQLLGTLGTTGRSTGPHLHYEVIYKDRVVNPYQVLQQTAAAQ
jgi:murein DD-endopeptidase MepM/ murein hydrolase activator NlpD